MADELKIVEFVDFDESYVKELNTWQEIEQQNNQDGIQRFVGDSNTLLGDYLSFVSSEMQIATKIVLYNGQVVGFVSYCINGCSAHIEIMGTSPKHRGQGFGMSILKTLKKQLNKQGISKITLNVKKENVAGIRSFSKVAKKNEGLNSDNYFGYEL